MPGSITMPSQCFDIFTVILNSAIIILFLVMFVLDEDKRRKGARSALSLSIRFGSGKPWSQNKVKTVHAPI